MGKSLDCSICERKFLKGFSVIVTTFESGNPIRELKMDYCPGCAPVGADQFKLEVTDRLAKMK